MVGTKCSRCGAPDADLFANDGAIVCSNCSVYDQLVASEVRLSQADLGVFATGDASHLVDDATSASNRRVVYALVCFALAAATGYFGAQMELAYVGAGVLGFLGLMFAFDAIRLRRFAKTKAPEIERRASSAPPPMMGDQP